MVFCACRGVWRVRRSLLLPRLRGPPARQGRANLRICPGQAGSRFARLALAAFWFRGASVRDDRPSAFQTTAYLSCGRVCRFRPSERVCTGRCSSVCEPVCRPILSSCGVELLVRRRFGRWWPQ
eukprot:9306374-Lingulodinium_polyedra.AAC.1